VKVERLREEIERKRRELVADLEKTLSAHPEWLELFRAICARGDEVRIQDEAADHPSRCGCEEGWEMVGLVHTHPKHNTPSISPWDIEIHLGDGKGVICAVGEDDLDGSYKCKCWEFGSEEEAQKAFEAILDCYHLGEDVMEKTGDPRVRSIVWNACAQKAVKPALEITLREGGR